MTTFFVTFTKKEYEIGINGVLHHIWTQKVASHELVFSSDQELKKC